MIGGGERLRHEGRGWLDSGEFAKVIRVGSIVRSCRLAIGLWSLFVLEFYSFI